VSWLLLGTIYLYGIGRLYLDGRWAELTLVGATAGALLVFLLVGLSARASPVGADILVRTKTWAWMIGIFLAAAASHAVVMFVLLAFLSYVALREYFSLLPMYDANAILRDADRPAIALAYLTVPVVYLLAYARWYGLYIILIPVYASLALPLVMVLGNNPRGMLASMGVIVCGMSLFVFLFSHAALLTQLSPFLLFYAVLVTELRDVLAYTFGKLLAPVEVGWARAVVAPTINPRKTWAASALAAVGCGVASALLAPLMPVLPAGQPTPVFLFVLGLVVGWLGLFGDLATGAIKRDLHVKDTGRSLPGHGGIVDRINGIVFTVPVVFHAIYYWYFPGLLRL